jgi:hypothetical protein
MKKFTSLGGGDAQRFLCWRQLESGVADDSWSSLDKAATVQHCRMNRARGRNYSFCSLSIIS